jgi:exodeoxyribonuclease VII small subunit
MAKAKTVKSYNELKEELDRIMLDLQTEDIDVDHALKCYSRGLELINSIEEYLKSADNSIKELKSKFQG